VIAHHPHTMTIRLSGFCRTSRTLPLPGYAARGTRSILCGPHIGGTPTAPHKGRNCTGANIQWSRHRIRRWCIPFYSTDVKVTGENLSQDISQIMVADPQTFADMWLIGRSCARPIIARARVSIWSGEAPRGG